MASGVPRVENNKTFNRSEWLDAIWPVHTEAWRIVPTCLLLGLVLRPMAARGDYQSVVLSDGASPYYRLNETGGTTAFDASAGARNGTYVSPSLVSFLQPGLLPLDSDAAVSFNGTGVRLPTTTTPAAESIEGWFKPTANVDADALVVRVDSTGSWQRMLWITAGWPEKNRFAYSFWISGVQYNVVGTTTVLPSRRYYVAVSVSMTGGRTAVQLYVNGVQEASLDVAGTPVNAARWQIGMEGGGALHNFIGVMDEVAFYTTILSPAQVSNHYVTGGALPTPGPTDTPTPTPTVAPLPGTLDTRWRVSPDIISCTGPTDASGTPWTDPLFDDSVWAARALPDTRKTTSGRVSRYYRGRFTLDAPAPVWLYFASDDGAEVFVNGTSLGSFGHGCANDGCNNLPHSCGINQCVPPLAVSADQLVAGTNVISVHMWNGPAGDAVFNMLVFPSSIGLCGDCTLNCVPPTPTRTPTNTPTPTPSPTPTPACIGRQEGDSCDDGNVCNGTDICDADETCVHSGNLPAATRCDDGDPCTLHDQCDGEGACVGVTYTGNYTVLVPTGQAALGKTILETDVTGKVCADDLLLKPFLWMQGDVVALRSSPTGPPTLPAVNFRHANLVDGACSTGGGWVLHPENLITGETCDTSGTAPALAECLAAQCTAAARWTEWANLPVTQGYNYGPIWVKRAQSLRIPTSGRLGSGTIVIDMPSLRLDGYTTLTLVGGATTEMVIVRVHGPVKLGRPATVRLLDSDGVVTPERILWIVDGPVKMHSFATFSGTVFADGPITIGIGSIIDGAMISNSKVSTGTTVMMKNTGFVGW